MQKRDIILSYIALLALEGLDCLRLILSGEEAINWVRQYIVGAVETDEQMQLIIEWMIE